MLVPRGRMFGCPVEFALDVIGGKWKTVILARLKAAPMRYGELRRAVPALADKMLTQRLRELEESGLIERAEVNGSSGYAVTPRGRSLGPALEALYAWGVTQGKEVGARFRQAAGSDANDEVAQD
jgi:DNA-binding HxlR family transcriptional regulator